MFWLALSILLLTLLFIKGLKIFNYIDHVAGIMEMIPGPTPYPFVGNLFQFGLKPDEYPKKILQYCRKYEFQGFRSLVFFQYHVMLSDPAEIQNMLSSSALLYKQHLYSFLRPWLGDGLLTSSGARWLKHHKIYVPAFEPQAIKGYLTVVQQTGEKFISKLMDVACGRRDGDGNGDDDDIFDVQQLVRKCTLDIVCETATGLPSNTLDGESTDFHAAIATLCNVIQERTFSIVKRFDVLFQLTPEYWSQRRALSTLKREMKTIIVERKRVLLESKSATNSPAQQVSRSFLDTLLSAKLDGRALKFEELFEELSTFIFTGHDPTASALSFTLYTLSRHAEVQRQVYAEQQGLFAGTGMKNDKEHELASLEQMIYLDAVIRETLRLYPAVPLIARTNRKAIEINGTKIAKRTTVIMCLIAMGYNEKYFDEPCAFRPERFLKTHQQQQQQNDVQQSPTIEAFKSVPFSAGPRSCVAEKYAMLKLKLLLSQIVRNFEILPARDGLPPGINDHSRPDCVPESEFDPILNIRVTLRSENGILIRLKKRE